MICWKWSIDSYYEKSYRNDQSKHSQNNNNNNNTNNNNIEGVDNVYSFNNNNNNSYDLSKISLKREELQTKLSDREMIGQRGYNPFNTNGNYVNDIVNRDIYLKPINTTQSTYKDNE
jgi:hypothetical protein